MRCGGTSQDPSTESRDQQSRNSYYDCRHMPSQDDGAATARIYYSTFDKYLDKWGYISSIFSKNSVMKGGFDK